MGRSAKAYHHHPRLRADGNASCRTRGPRLDLSFWGGGPLGRTGAKRLVAALGLCVAGAAVSGLLLLQHHGESRAVAAVDQACGEGDGAANDCETVARSSWSSVKGIPVAALGVLFYASLSLLLALTLLSPRAPRRPSPASRSSASPRPRGRRRSCSASRRSRSEPSAPVHPHLHPRGRRDLRPASGLARRTRAGSARGARGTGGSRGLGPRHGGRRRAASSPGSSRWTTASSGDR